VSAYLRKPAQGPTKGHGTRTPRVNRGAVMGAIGICAVAAVAVTAVIVLRIGSPSPSPSPSPAPAPAPAPGPGPGTKASAPASMARRTECAATPSSCGYPDSTNTGVASGISLAKVPAEVSSGQGWHWDDRGWIIVDGDGAVLENIETDSAIDVSSSGATIRNVRITASGEGWGIGLRHTRNATIDGVRIASTPGRDRLIVGIKDVYGDATGTRVLHSNISGVSTGIQTHEGLIQDNYIHDMGYLPKDHLNGATSNGSTVPLAIRHNTILNQYDQTDAIGLFQDFGLEANRVIDNNLIAGGSYSIYGGQNAGAPTAHNIKIINNRISRIFFPNGGTFGPVGAFDPDAPGNEFSGNVWDDTNKGVSL